MLKKNEEIAESFVNQYASYGESITKIENQFDLGKYINNMSEYASNTGIKPTDEEISMMLDEFYKKREVSLKEAKERLKPEKEKLKSILKSFTQEMLVLAYSITQNSILKEEILEQIKNNNFDIDYLNNLASESGAIFQNLELMEKEKLVRIISLRETTGEIIFEQFNLQSLNPDVVKMIIKVMNNQTLEEEKIAFCKKHNLSNELEFQFYKKSIENQSLLSIATDAQNIFNSITNIEDNSIIDMAYDNMSKINIGIVGKKK